MFKPKFRLRKVGKSCFLEKRRFLFWYEKINKYRGRNLYRTRSGNWPDVATAMADLHNIGMADNMLNQINKR